jgi:hypothetical protein
MTELSDYIKDNYGHCKTYDPNVRESCACLKNGHIGRLCPNWVAVSENNWEKMIEKLQKEHSTNAQKAPT